MQISNLLEARCSSSYTLLALRSQCRRRCPGYYRGDMPTCASPCSIIFCEAVAIYGIIVAIILQTKIDWVEPDAKTGLYSNEVYFAGYAILGSGLTAGWANLACGCDPISLLTHRCFAPPSGRQTSACAALIACHCMRRSFFGSRVSGSEKSISG